MQHPTYTCVRIDGAINLTGKADDSQWAKADPLDLTDPITGKSLPMPAYARLLYNDQYLYVAFYCTDDFVQAAYTERDSSVWEEGCCEVFLSPSGKMRQYYELNVSPLNTVFDSFILNGTNHKTMQRNMVGFVDFTCAGMITKVHIDGELGVSGAQGWTAEYAIPFSSVIGNDHLIPEPGDEWLMNLCHITSPKQKNDFVFYSWANIGRVDFHLPWTWGTLRFA